MSMLLEMCKKDLEPPLKGMISNSKLIGYMYKQHDQQSYTKSTAVYIYIYIYIHIHCDKT